MGAKTKIEWTDASWTPIRARYVELQSDGSGKERIGWHCEHVSEGCRFCYAESINLRLGTGRPFKPGELYREERRFHSDGEVKLFLDEEMLLAPLKWKRPRMVFVCSMTDLFADFVPDEWIDRIFAVMALCPQHSFQVLTKRAERMRAFIDNLHSAFIATRERLLASPDELADIDRADRFTTSRGEYASDLAEFPHFAGSVGHPSFNLHAWPLPNVWLGVSAERQKEADERIPHLLGTPAAVRFVSLEPLLGAIELWRFDEEERAPRGIGIVRSGGVTPSTPHSPPEGYDDSYPGLNWVIVGGESGRDARPMHPDWARSLRDQCTAASVAFFMKQWGTWLPMGPEDDWGREWMLLDANGILDIPDHRAPDFGAGEVPVRRVGKKAAGRLLDGRTWDEMPSTKREPAAP